MKVLLVCMPFADLSRPALGLSLLKARLHETGVACDVAYLNLAFGQMVGAEDYGRVCPGLPSVTLAGEWVFAAALNGTDGGDAQEYVADVLEHGWRPGQAEVEAALRARSLARRFLDDALSRVPWSEYDIVGFGSFGAQNAAALALARRVTERHPAVRVVFGGHNWSGSMGIALHRQFPFVDTAFLGHADASFPQLVRALARGDDAAARAAPGTCWRSADGRQHVTAAGPARLLDALPTPDHGDYFRALRDNGMDGRLEAAVPLETSRGCWWAKRTPCMFCGGNGEEDRYSSKSPSRILQEIRELAVAWPGRLLDVADNVVSPRFLSDVLPGLAGSPEPPRLHFRIRPDVTLDSLKLIAAANASVMCGIESLDDGLLALINKGVSRRENLRLLQRCAELGVRVDWNLLFAIPGEAASDYARQVELIDDLVALDPPAGVAPLALERYSPFWLRPAEHGFGTPRAAAAYSYVYPFPRSTLAEIAYFFDHDYSPSLSVRLHVTRLQRAVEAWQEQRRESRLDPGRGRADRPAQNA